MKFKPKEYWTPITITSKHLHLIFVITWFAGLFYIPRLFIYHIEANAKGSPEREILGTQLKLMAKRLWYIIAWPSAILATVFALLLLYIIPLGCYKIGWLSNCFLWRCYFFTTTRPTEFFLAFQQDDIRYSSLYMRIWNEGATILLFSIVFLVILKSSFHWIFGCFRSLDWP